MARWVRFGFVPGVDFGVKWLRELDFVGRIEAGVILAQGSEGTERFATGKSKLGFALGEVGGEARLVHQRAASQYETSKCQRRCKNPHNAG